MKKNIDDLVENIISKSKKRKIIILGTSYDNGIDHNLYFGYNYDYSDLAITLYRLIYCCNKSKIKFDKIIPLDKKLIPIALSLAKIFKSQISFLNTKIINQKILFLSYNLNNNKAYKKKYSLFYKQNKILNFVLHLPYNKIFNNKISNAEFIGLLSFEVTLPWHKNNYTSKMYINGPLIDLIKKGKNVEEIRNLIRREKINPHEIKIKFKKSEIDQRNNKMLAKDIIKSIDNILKSTKIEDFKRFYESNRSILKKMKKSFDS